MYRKLRGANRTSAGIHIKILKKLEKRAQNWDESRNTDTQLYLKNPVKAIWANIIIGISRGVGFVIGVSVIGVITITLLAKFLSKFVTIPVIGEFLALIVKSVQQYLK